MSESFEDRYYLTNPTLSQRIGRNFRLYRETIAFLVFWMVKGRKVRRALAEAEKNGTVMELESQFGEQQP